MYQQTKHLLPMSPHFGNLQFDSHWKTHTQFHPGPEFDPYSEKAHLAGQLG